MNMKSIIWFGNDADGLSMVDFLAVGTFIIWSCFKVAHIALSIIYQNSNNLLLQLNLIMLDVNQFMSVIIYFYFTKKTLDTTITKIGLLRNKQYKMPEPPTIVEVKTEDTQQG